jgi:uncharacterized membrane protein
MKKGFWIAMVISVVTAVVAGVAIVGAEGEKVPVHWNIHGEADAYGSAFYLLIFPVVSFLATLLLYFLPKIDPKSENIKKSGPLLPVTMVLIAVLMLGIAVIMTMAIHHGSDILNLMTFLCLALGTLFIAMGYYLPRVKHNYMMGIRTPWTLYSEKIWTKTHRASKWWMISAGVLFLVSIFLPSPVNLILPISYVGVVMIGLVVYSYSLFAKEKKK